MSLRSYRNPDGETKPVHCPDLSDTRPSSCPGTDLIGNPSSADDEGRRQKAPLLLPGRFLGDIPGDPPANFSCHDGCCRTNDRRSDPVSSGIGDGIPLEDISHAACLPSKHDLRRRQVATRELLSVYARG